MTTQTKNHLLFFAAASWLAFLMLHHELWLDEAHHWLISSTASRIPDLIHLTRYEGHPLLWNLILFVLAKVFSSYVSMICFHWLIVAFSIWLITYRTSLTTFQKLLVLSGYLFIFEYGVLSRNYAIGVLLILTIAVSLKNKTSGLAAVFALILLPQTNLFGLLFSISVAVIYWNDLLVFLNNKAIQKTAVGIIFFCSLLLSVWFMFPASDHPLLDKLFTVSSDSFFDSGFRLIMLGFLNVPNFSLEHWWNSNVFYSQFGKYAVVLVFLLVPIFYLLYTKIKSAFYFLSINVGLIFAFAVLSGFSSGRYFGFIYISVLFVVILHQEMIFKQFSKWSVYLLLVLQSAAGLMAGYKEITTNFSGSRETAEYIQKSEAENVMIVAAPFNVIPPLSLYLKQDVFSLDTERPESYCKWNIMPVSYDNDEKIRRLKRILDVKRNLIFISPVPLPSHIDGINVLLLFQNSNSVVRSEKYFTYRLSLN